MGLDLYRRKRDFARTPEPKGAVARPATVGLRFVVQKHAASRLHYDFRLEMDGVLKSWAVPKGPSLDPGEKRLAVQVEDHPIDYMDFEGVIPEGEYGGGTVMVWDIGTWEPDGDPAAAYAKGHLRFTLRGKRLKGDWSLARMRGPESKNWLLIKHRDRYATPGSGDDVVQRHQRSVLSRRGMDGIAAARERVWSSNRPARTVAARSAVSRVAQTVALRPPVDPGAIPGARRGPIPAKLEPQLATLVETAPEGDEWLHEIKLDGYRMLARLQRGKVTILSRNGKDWTATVPEIAAAAARLPVESAVLDGEVVHIEPSGISSFSALKDDLSAQHTAPLLYYVFDLLYLDGYRLIGARLIDRKAALAELVAMSPEDRIRLSEHIVGDGRAFHEQACKHGLEGIVSKRCDAPYRPGRSAGWVKVKCGGREEFVIIGWTDPEGKRQGFGSLVLGYYDAAGELRYAGGVGTGFTGKTLAELSARLAKIAADGPPSAEIRRAAPRRTHWVKPRLVAEIRFSEWTSDGRLRHPSFLGLRGDKSAREVVRDPERGTALRAAPVGADTPRTVSARDTVAVAGVRLTHAGKVLYPEKGITKLDLAQYYAAVAPYMLPHVRGRPLTLVRCPEGWQEQCFYQKHVEFGIAGELERIAITEKDGTGLYLIANDLAGLVALVQMGVLEIHVWGSTGSALEQPDRVVFDLDPDEMLPWERVVRAAVAVRDLLAELGLLSFPKGTGGKGLHVVVPLRPELDWDQIKQFTRSVAEELVRREPAAYTASMAKKARHGRIFIDYLRNQRGATAIAPYSARARLGAPVAVPLAWKEVEDGVRSDQFNISNLPSRLAALTEDPWREMTRLEQSVPPAIVRRLRR